MDDNCFDSSWDDESEHKTSPFTAETPFESFIFTLKDSLNYPSNLRIDDLHRHTVEALREQLADHAWRLFSEDDADVCLQEMYRPDEGFNRTHVHDENALRKHLELPLERSRPDPRYRFILMHAPNSRSSLNISEAMFLRTLTYHNVMPVFLEYIFPFGTQHYRRDAYGGSFRSESCLATDERRLPIPELGRSGWQLEFCYSLQSVERSGDERRPWSVRPCSVWFTTDLVHERQAWIVVKGNTLMNDIISKRLDNMPQVDRTPNGSISNSLTIHLEFARWSAENWYWYLNSLEESLQGQTRTTLSTRIGRSETGVSLNASAFSRSSTVCEKSVDQPQPMTRRLSRRTWSFGKSFLRKESNLSETQNDQSTEDQWAALQQSKFSFDDLQRLQGLEEKGNDARMVLTSNREVLCQLRKEYRSLIDWTDCPTEIGEKCKNDVKRFERKLSSLEAEFGVLLARVDTFSRLLQERKNLLYGMLQYQNMQASLFLSQASQRSTTKMEGLTEKMHFIAQQTQNETVSMKIITVVTLFFLPGTFISTLMSTPVITFERQDRGIGDTHIGLGALQFFVTVSVPLMCGTFAVWAIMHRVQSRKEREKSSKGLE